MICKVCGKDFMPTRPYQQIAKVCSDLCWQDIYNEPDIGRETDEDSTERELQDND